MGSSILNVGQSALAAAQAGLVTTGHNIANASTPGYTRQVVIQGSLGSQNNGFGFLGKGTEITDIRRVYDELLAERVRNAETKQNHVATYHTQVSRINEQLADSTAGLSPVLQNFFKGVQDLASNPSSTTPASRQSALSSAEAMVSRFQSLDGQLKEMGQQLNSQIQSSIESINVYAKQIATLNDAIEKATAGADGKAPNDLLDQRDLAVTELSKQIKTSVVKQGNSFNVFIGNGQPLVVGVKTSTLIPMKTPTDPGKIIVGLRSDGANMAIDDEALPGGKLGGLLEFRKNSLDVAENSLGRIALGLAMTFNAQHRLGQDQNGALGGDFFSVSAKRTVNPSSANTSTNVVGATISDVGMVTTSDYKLQVVGTNFVVTRLSDNTQMYSGNNFTAASTSIEGVTLSIDVGTAASFANGDEFIIRPTAGAASEIKVAIKDIAKIAAAAPVRTASATSNAGNATISAAKVDSTYPGTPLLATVTLRYNQATNQLDTVPGGALGFPRVYADGSDVGFNGINVAVSGVPKDGDTFTISPNTNGVGDSRNAVLLGQLQTATTMAGKTSTYQGAYAQLVSQIGNKARELEVTSKAETKFLEQAVAAQQAESGVNLDEEATNLLRYQQAYQAAGKVMQTASQLFDLLLTIGGQ